jgi:hypothetical protein
MFIEKYYCINKSIKNFRKSQKIVSARRRHEARISNLLDARRFQKFNIYKKKIKQKTKHEVYPAKIPSTI